MQSLRFHGGRPGCPARHRGWLPLTEFTSPYMLANQCRVVSGTKLPTLSLSAPADRCTPFSVHPSAPARRHGGCAVATRSLKKAGAGRSPLRGIRSPVRVAANACARCAARAHPPQVEMQESVLGCLFQSSAHLLARHATPPVCWPSDHGRSLAGCSVLREVLDPLRHVEPVLRAFDLGGPLLRVTGPGFV